MSETLDNTPQTNQRPTFLTVLCILSFIAAGISILALLLGTVVAGAAQSVVNEAENAGAEVDSAMGSIWGLIIVSTLLVVASLVGVIKMWKLQKQGFYIYAGASVVNIIAGAMMGGFSAIGVVVAVAFIAMYGANLKHMS